MAEERPFSVAVLFGVVWVVLAYLAGVLVLPVRSYLNIGLCSLAVLLCVMNYVNEYLGKFPLDYSKFASDGEINARLGWSLTYALPAVIQIVLWYIVGMPQTTFHLVALVTFVGHFGKRVLEVLFLHKYSKKISVLGVAEVSTFYSVGSIVQHYWCNIYTDNTLAVNLSSNHTALTVGVVLYITGEFINLYHHWVLAKLRPAGISSGYTVPQGGLFSYVVCAHYCGEVIAWYGMAVVCNHLCIYLAWMVIVCYLAGRSHQTQLWYQKKIENFPKDRRNLFPGVY